MTVIKDGEGIWPVDNDAAARIKSSDAASAVIVPVKAGSTVVNCKVNGKTLSCRVEVLNNSVGSTDDIVGPESPCLVLFKGQTDILSGNSTE